ncbi:MAG TPA: TIR domain-containing protein [Sphingomicrobium sp.]|jgi:adenylate cyclase
MADVFVSYAREDEPQAERVADALRAEGYQVWRDDELPAHRAYAEVIEERLRDAEAVVVLWSANAAKSQWVRAEADAARATGKLIQATLDGSVPPMPFNQIQCADLDGWTGKDDAPGWKKLKGSVAALAAISTDVPQRKGREAGRDVSVCVLPFGNMSGDPEQEYFSDGISEDITTDLSKISALEVIARNTAFQFKGQSPDVSEVARKLAVTHVLEGSVRKAGNRVRITAQLIDGRTGGHVWAERYDRDLTDIFAIQDEISKAIVDALKVKLLPEEREAIEERETSSAEAYNLYLMARKYWVSGNYGDVRREELVVRICGRAVEIDPDYARAWALMAIAQTNLWFTFDREGEREKALAAAEHALSIDPDLAEAHCVKARHLFEEQHIEESDAEIHVALDLDPESWEVNREAARILYRQRRIPEATRYFEKAVGIFETDFHAWGMLASCYQALGDRAGVERAAKNMIEQSEGVLAEDPSNAAALGMGAGGLAILGERQRTQDWIDRALLIDPGNTNMRYNFACVVALHLHDYDAAIDLLDGVVDEIPPSLFRNVLIDPDLDCLRDLPRFRAMVDRTASRLGMEDELAALSAEAVVGN